MIVTYNLPVENDKFVRVRSRAIRGGQLVRPRRLMAHLAIERLGRLDVPPLLGEAQLQGAEARGMAEQLGRLRCLVAHLATECVRRLDASAMRAEAQLQGA